MKKTIAILAVLAMAGMANAAPDAYEPFNYPLGAFASGTAVTGTGLSGTWTVPGAGFANIVAGLSYSNLLTANNALQQANNGSSRSLVNFATPLSSGTKFVGFLLKNSGDSGGNWAGAYLKGDNTTSLFVGFTAGFNGTLNHFGLGSVNTASTAPTGGSALGTSGLINNTNVHLVVVQIDFNISGVNDRVTLYIDPVAGTNSPGVSATTAVTTFDVGNISGIGLNLQGGSPTMTLDEIRVGSTYADVVGANLAPTIPTTLALSIAASKQVSWTAFSTNYYQPQSSTDGSSWNNLGSLLYGSTVTSVYDTAPVAFYQVEEILPLTSQAIVDGGFEVDGGIIDGNDTAFYWSSAGNQAPTRITSDFRSGPACLSITVTNVDASPNVCEAQQNLLGAGGSGVAGGNAYDFSFWAKQISSGVSYVQQYKLTWLDSGSAIVGQIGFINFTGGSGTWTKISPGAVIAPASAVNALIQIRGNTGAILNGFGSVLIDDVSLIATTPTGSINILSPTVRNGAVFTGVVKTNGVTAAAASGTISFKTNSVGQSATSVSSGSADSAPATVPSSYTVTATYSGDATYIGSTASLTVGSSFFGTGPSSVSLASGQATVVMSGIAGTNYFMRRATNVTFTAGISNFPTVIAPGNGNVSVTDNFGDLGAVPKAAFYRLVHPLP